MGVSSSGGASWTPLPPIKLGKQDRPHSKLTATFVPESPQQKSYQLTQKLLFFCP
jgi:hypothetical protein